MGFFDKFKKKKNQEKKEISKKKEEILPKVEPQDKKVIKKIAKKSTGQYHWVLIRPLVTEKVSFLGSFNQYVFEVAPKANKIDIEKAIKSLYGVEPVKVNVMKVSGKVVHYGRRQGRTKNWKKAVVTLKQGEKIEVYEGV